MGYNGLANPAGWFWQCLREGAIRFRYCFDSIRCRARASLPEIGGGKLLLNEPAEQLPQDHRDRIVSPRECAHRSVREDGCNGKTRMDNCGVGW